MNPASLPASRRAGVLLKGQGEAKAQSPQTPGTRTQAEIVSRPGVTGNPQTAQAAGLSGPGQAPHTSSAGTPPSSATIFRRAATVLRMGTARPTRRNRWLLQGKASVTLRNLEDRTGATSLGLAGRLTHTRDSDSSSLMCPPTRWKQRVKSPKIAS